PPVSTPALHSFPTRRSSDLKYDWSPEHHFLTHYSHQPAPEIFLSWVAARTRRIHVGYAIVNITPPVNHPARVAERIATMDHLSEDRKSTRLNSSHQIISYAV